MDLIEIIGFSVVALALLGIGILSIVSVRKGTEALEEIAWGEASKYRRIRNEEE